MTTRSFDLIRTFPGAPGNMVSAMTTAVAEDATGMALAARAACVPIAISFTVETDGRLPSDTSSGEAIDVVDDATGGYPAYFMLNCAPREHCVDFPTVGDTWVRRAHGLRAKASRLSQAELNASETLEDSDQDELGRRHLRLRRTLPRLHVPGGCVGTGESHARTIGDRCFGSREGPRSLPGRASSTSTGASARLGCHGITADRVGHDGSTPTELPIGALGAVQVDFTDARCEDATGLGPNALARYRVTARHSHVCGAERRRDRRPSP